MTPIKPSRGTWMSVVFGAVKKKTLQKIIMVLFSHVALRESVHKRRRGKIIIYVRQDFNKRP